MDYKEQKKKKRTFKTMGRFPRMGSNLQSLKGSSECFGAEGKGSSDAASSASASGSPNDPRLQKNRGGGARY